MSDSIIKFSIKTQPENKQFRYLSECLSDNRGPNNKVKFCVSNVNQEVIVYVSCVDTNEPHFVLSHVLIGENCVKGIAKFEIGKREEREINFEFLICLIRRTEEDYKKRYDQLKDFKFLKLNESFDKKKPVKNETRLCFQIVLKNDQENSLKTVYSDIIISKIFKIKFVEEYKQNGENIIKIEADELQKKQIQKLSAIFSIDNLEKDFEMEISKNSIKNKQIKLSLKLDFGSDNHDLDNTKKVKLKLIKTDNQNKTLESNEIELNYNHGEVSKNFKGYNNMYFNDNGYNGTQSMESENYGSAIESKNQHYYSYNNMYFNDNGYNGTQSMESENYGSAIENSDAQNNTYEQKTYDENQSIESVKSNQLNQEVNDPLVKKNQLFEPKENGHIIKVNDEISFQIDEKSCLRCTGSKKGFQWIKKLNQYNYVIISFTLFNNFILCLTVNSQTEFEIICYNFEGELDYSPFKWIKSQPSICYGLHNKYKRISVDENFIYLYEEENEFDKIDIETGELKTKTLASLKRKNLCVQNSTTPISYKKIQPKNAVD